MTPAARKVATPQAVACRLPCLLAWAKTPADIAAARATPSTKVRGSGAATQERYGEAAARGGRRSSAPLHSPAGSLRRRSLASKRRSGADSFERAASAAAGWSSCEPAVSRDTHRRPASWPGDGRRRDDVRNLYKRSDMATRRWPPRAATSAQRGVRVTAVGTGVTRTPGTGRVSSGPSEEASRAMHPLGRLGAPEDVASAMARPLESSQRRLTGRVVGVDGGVSATRPRA